MRSSPQNLRVPYALSVYDDSEVQSVVKVLTEHRSNMGIETSLFEKNVSRLFGKKYGTMVNSGSSANLLSLELLQLPEGSEVITPALTFSTTVAPLVQKKLVPVFADVEEGTYQINVHQIELLITSKTKALFIPYLLGNVPDLKILRNIAKKHNLFFIEDSCDTLGATYANKPTGNYSDISTTSFFGSHIITAGGNGGMVMVNNTQWNTRLKLLRGWGRRSSLLSETEDIEKRFASKIGGMVYDAKFTFDAVGYNFLPNEMCAAFGNVQLKKLKVFKKRRMYNFTYLLNFFKHFEEYFILPRQLPEVETQWLAFPVTLKKGTPFNRQQIVTFLEKHNIQTRPIFTGNITYQPGFKKIRHRVIKSGTPETNGIMERGFVIGCHHGLAQEQLEKMTQVLSMFFEKSA